MAEKSTKLMKTIQGKIQFTEKGLNQIEALAGVGLTNDDIANWFGISRATFYRRLEDSGITRDTLERGKARAHAKIAKKAFTMAESGSDGAMTRWWLERRENKQWGRKDKIEVSGEDGGPIKVEDQFLKKVSEMTVEEMEDFLAKKRRD